MDKYVRIVKLMQLEQNILYADIVQIYERAANKCHAAMTLNNDEYEEG